MWGKQTPGGGGGKHRPQSGIIAKAGKTRLVQEWAKKNKESEEEEITESEMFKPQVKE